jgi:hypothetical protein
VKYITNAKLKISAGVRISAERIKVIIHSTCPREEAASAARRKMMQAKIKDRLAKTSFLSFMVHLLTRALCALILHVMFAQPTCANAKEYQKH